MRCRFKHKIFQNEENGYTIAIFTTQDTSVPLSARDKYLASRNIIGFSAIGFGLPLTDEIELEMEGRWESGEHGTQYQVENFMEVVPRTKEGILGYLSSGAVKGIGLKMADTIFRKFGLQTLEIMENNPQIHPQYDGYPYLLPEGVHCPEETAHLPGIYPEHMLSHHLPRPLFSLCIFLL